MSKKINVICGRKYVPREDATLVFVCNIEETQITRGKPNKSHTLWT